MSDMSISLVIFGCITIIVGIVVLAITFTKSEDLKRSEVMAVKNQFTDYYAAAKPLHERFTELKKKYAAVKVCIRKEDMLCESLLEGDDLDTTRHHLNKYGEYNDRAEEIVHEMNQIVASLKELRKQYGIYDKEESL